MKLIEKLEQEYQEWCDREDNSVFGDVSQIDARGRTRGLKDAIKIVEQHSEWVSVKECLPPEEIKLLFEHEDYGVVIGYYRDRGEFVTYDTHCNHRDSIDKFLKWCYIPISEVEVYMCDLHNEKEVGMCNVGCNNNISDKKMLLVYDTLMLRWYECRKLSHEHRVNRNYTIAVKWEAKAEAYKEAAKILANAISG